MVSIIINPVAGGATPGHGRRRATLATAILAARGISGDVFVTERRGHARQLAEAACRRGHRLVVAWGGDGTVNEVASALLGGVARLGIVPSGSGNGLARELRVPRRPADAIASALDAPVRTIDAGEIGGRLFVSIAGIGFDAHVAAAFDRGGHLRRGFSTYVRITARELWRYRCGVYSVDRADRREALLITFANTSQFGNGARIAPRAKLDDGLLDMVVVAERSRAATIRGLPRLFTGGAERVPGVAIRQVERARVESEAPMTYHVDGEPVQGGRCLEARVLPGVLRVAAL
ncbi:MAG: diacylglycerol kinase family protein [Vicinamibacterales bacterium]